MGYALGVNGLICLVLSGISLVGGYLPPAISKCRRSSPNLNQCIAEKIEQLRPNFLTGDYGNGTLLEPLDPIKIDRFVIDDGRNVRLVFNQLVCNGGRFFKLEKVSADVKDRRISIRVTFPQMEFTGKYNMRLKISVLQINGKGLFQIMMTNVRVTLRIRYAPEQVDGKETLRVLPVESKIVFDGEKHFNMTDLFKGNPALTAAANQAINENPDVIVDAATPVAEEFLTGYYHRLTQGIFREASEDEVFPE